jgi:hypothetical protein
MYSELIFTEERVHRTHPKDWLRLMQAGNAVAYRVATSSALTVASQLEPVR